MKIQRKLDAMVWSAMPARGAGLMGRGHDCALHSKWQGFPPQTFKYAKLDPFVNPTAIDRAIKIAENSNAQA